MNSIRKNGKENKQETVYRQLSPKQVLFKPDLARALGSINAAILIGQILYWQGLGKWGDYVYKTESDMEIETALTRTMQVKVIKDMTRIGVLEIKYHGNHGKRHYKVHIDILKSLINEYTKTCSVPNAIPGETLAGNKRTITESTTKNTTYNIDRKKLFRSNSLDGNAEYVIGQIAVAIKETDLTFLRSVVTSRGLPVIQRAYGLLKEELNSGKEIENKAAYLNTIIKNLA